MSAALIEIKNIGIKDPVLGADFSKTAKKACHKFSKLDGSRISYAAKDIKLKK